MSFVSQSNSCAGTAQRAVGSQSGWARLMEHLDPSLFASRSPTAPSVAARHNLRPNGFPFTRETPRGSQTGRAFHSRAAGVMPRAVRVPHVPLSGTAEPIRTTARRRTHSKQKLAAPRGRTVGSSIYSFIVLPSLMERDITLYHKVSQPPKAAPRSATRRGGQIGGGSARARLFSVGNCARKRGADFSPQDGGEAKGP